MTDELLDFIQAEHAAGMSLGDIRRILETEGGWDKTDVDEALNSLGIIEPLENAPQVESPVEQKNEAPVASSTPDDFLGIFSASTKEAEHAVEPISTPIAPTVSHAAPSPVSPVSPTPPPQVAPTPVIPTPESIVFPVASIPEEKPKPVFGFSLEKALARSTSQNDSTTLPPPTPLSSPIIPEIKKSESSLEQLVSKVEHEEALTTAPALGLSKTDSFPQTLDEVNTTNVNVTFEKPLETKALNDVWAQSLEKKTPDTVLSATPVASPTKELTPLSGKRTMASDILLRGRGLITPGMPAIALPEATKIPIMSVTPSLEVPPSPTPMQPVVPSVSKPTLATPPLAEVLARRNKTKRAIMIGLTLLVTVFLIAGGVFAFMQSRGPDTQTLFTNALSKFFAATSFGYNGSASSDVVLSATQNGVGQNGTVKFTSDYSGTLLQSAAGGFGDGLHHLKFTGGLQSGTLLWNTDVEADFRMFGTALYMHILSFPRTNVIDPDLFKTYWIKVDIAEIAKELAISGVDGQGDYGTFGDGSNANNFTALVAKEFPFTAGEKLPNEVIGGVSATHIRLTTDPEHMLLLTTLLYHKFTNKDLVLDTDAQLRLKNAFTKVKGEVWIDPTTNMLLKLSVEGNFDDDMAGMHMKGPVHMTFEFSGYGQGVAVTPPTPMLTLEELRARMDDFKKVEAARTRDQVKINQLTTIMSALKVYQSQKGRYPSFLSDLTQANMLATSTFDSVTLKSFFYVSYVKPDMLTKAGRCVVKGKNCGVAHVGVNLEDATNPALESDADQTTDVHGADASGCGDEQNFACYDLTLGLATTTTPTP